MRILAIKTFDGVSIYAKKSVMVLWVSLGKLTDTASTEVAHFNERLLAILPGLREHCCSEGVKGGFVHRLRIGTYPAHILEHMILELQTMLGDDVRYGKTRKVAEGVYRIIVGILHPQTAMLCARVARAILSALYREKPISLTPYLAMMQKCHRAERFGPSTTALVSAAQRRNIPIEIMGEEQLLLLGWGKHRVRMWATISDRTSLVGADIAADKSLTSRLLEAGGVRVPRHIVAETLSEALVAWRKLGKTVVIKPLCGHQGKGVTVGVHSVRELDRAMRTAKVFGERVILEQQVRGREYRLLVVGGKMVACAERIPAYVRGDGTRSVRELIERVNCDPRRGEGHDRELTRITIDTTVVTTLAQIGYSLASIPRQGEVVYLRHSANLSTGGTAVDVTDIVHPSVRQEAETAAELVGLDIAGIDLISEDITREGATIIEVNAAPGIRMHHSPTGGSARDAAGAIVEHLMNGTDGRIPLVAVTGTNGKTTVTRLIAHIWQRTGRTIGMTSTGGIYRNGTCLAQGDTTGKRSARRLFADRTLDGAVLETARGGMIRQGLAFDQCDIGIVTNISDDHLGQDGIGSQDELAEVKSLVLETVKTSGAGIINADDSYASMLAKRTAGEVIYVSLRADNPLICRHLAIGGRAFFVRDHTIRLAQGSQEQQIADLQAVPITMGGYAEHQMQNCLLACAGAWMLGIGEDIIQEGLLSFVDNQGRMTMIEIGEVRICVDYGHNAAGYRAVLDTVSKLGAKRLVGVIGAPGDRTDETLISLGQIAGEGFARLYIKEDRDLRGRVAGETATLLAEGARHGGAKVREITLLLQEQEAVRRALKDSRAGDLIVIFYEDYDGVMAQIEAYRAEYEARYGIEPSQEEITQTKHF